VIKRQQGKRFFGSNLPISGLLNLFVVYCVWGSTFLAIRIAVREGSGFPPFYMASTRLALGGLILLAFALIRGERVMPSREELKSLITSALMLCVGGNGLIVWAEQRMDSGFTALIVGTVPIWAAVLEAFLNRRRPSWKLVCGLLLGFAGLIVLLIPIMKMGGRSDVLSVIALLVATISWVFGAFLQARRPMGLKHMVSSCWQQLLASVMFGMLIILMKEPLPTPTVEAWMAWAYLLIFGSLIAFTSYVAALKQLPTSLVMTHGYVNPVVAVLLGWLVLSEPLTVYTIGGMLTILFGVGMVFRDRAV